MDAIKPRATDKLVRKVYEVLDQGFFYGSWVEKGVRLTLLPIQAEHYLSNGRLKLVEDSNKIVAGQTGKKPASDKLAPPSQPSRRVGSYNDPGKAS